MHEGRQDSPKAQTDDELGTITDTTDHPEIGQFPGEHLKYELTFVDETPADLSRRPFELGPTPSPSQLPTLPRTIRSPPGLCRHNAVIFNWADPCTESPDKIPSKAESTGGPTVSEGECGSERKVHTRPEHRETAEAVEKVEQSSTKHHHELHEDAEGVAEPPQKRRRLNRAVERVGKRATRSSSNSKRKQKSPSTPPNMLVTRRLRPRKSKRI